MYKNPGVLCPVTTARLLEPGPAAWSNVNATSDNCQSHRQTTNLYSARCPHSSSQGRQLALVVAWQTQETLQRTQFFITLFCLQPLKPEARLNNIQESSPYCKEITTFHHYKNKCISIFKEIIAVSSQKCTKPKALCELNADLTNVKADDKYNYH